MATVQLTPKQEKQVAQIRELITIRDEYGNTPDEFSLFNQLDRVIENARDILEQGSLEMTLILKVVLGPLSDEDKAHIKAFLEHRDISIDTTTDGNVIFTRDLTKQGRERKK